jgi:FkbM family methyltransferase
MIDRIKNRLISLVFGEGARIAYSQEGEDLLLERFLGDRHGGFYVDVGAHHPTRFSNTYRFYQRGWRGIVIDPLPGTRRRFRGVRPRDICLELGVSSEPGELCYYAFTEPALNTFSESVAAERVRTHSSTVIAKTQIPIRRLDDILAQHLPPATAIDILSVDVEGLDINVLQSNDWLRWRPQWVLAESLSGSLQAVHDRSDPISSFMHGQGYTAQAKTDNSVFYRANP